ncbi:uncharacterized protein BP5553_03588 [Venustampulla echinocandica]|uniref:LysM domain-containing protein n=1 Tax=Venustampulla echinocandica TaxID=2656787 RepID=A0A370TUU6_9HELO|nr:uncharacterized protein BP5553_03588 [Venustampulla echinocandica]RDL39248.1 hypothetical protein BP5553_03588 [Venustampulla echinocandica]
MYQSIIIPGLLLLGSLLPTSSAISVGRLRRDESPALPHDPDTTKYCTWWFDNDGSIECSAMPASWAISLPDFLRWNPSITPECSNFNTGSSYCVEAYGEPPPTTTTTTSAATTTTPTGNGIVTPTPIQAGMASNCDAFHFVAAGEGCAGIASAAGISLSQFYNWNPAAGTSCAGLWSETYCCISITGIEPSTTTTTSTTTAPGNGIATPTPIQSGMVTNCNKFYLVPAGEGCATIVSKNGISLSQFTTWNPAAGSTCAGLWADTYCCVGIIGFTPPTTTSAPPTTTAPGNGIATPTPYQTGMTTSCKTFHLVVNGDNCDSISRTAGISLAQFYAWNPAAGKDTCAGLWLDTYCCISVL